MLFFFTFFYLLFSFLTVYPSMVFISAGLTIPQLFSSLLGSENEHFVQYHVKKIALLAFVHSCLPLGYATGLMYYKYPRIASLANLPGEIKLLWTVCLIIPIVVALKIIDWYRNDWEQHPVYKNLVKFTDLVTACSDLAVGINFEFKNADKVCLSTNGLTKTIVTDNWIIQVNFYGVNFARQSDAVMIVKNSDTHQLSPINGGEQQFIDIQVISHQYKASPFYIRLNSLDFKELQSKVIKPIVILPHIVFHTTVIEKFIEIFKTQISINEKFVTNQDLELCIGCMQARSNVKINKQCTDVENYENDDATPNCEVCRCRPMWCDDCMGRWFATRQDAEHPEMWLGSKCTCPLCRRIFCIYDVCYVELSA